MVATNNTLLVLSVKSQGDNSDALLEAHLARKYPRNARSKTLRMLSRGRGEVVGGLS